MSSRTPKPAARPAAGASATPAAKPVAASARVVRTPAGAASRTAAAGAAPVDAARGDGRQKVARHVDERVAARNT